MTYIVFTCYCWSIYVFDTGQTEKYMVRTCCQTIQQIAVLEPNRFMLDHA